MNIHPRPQTDFHGDASLAALMAALADHDNKALVIEYGGRTIRPGYHVTEVKLGSFATLDCGGNPDQWNETILQVEDVGPEEDNSFMPVRKFKAILEKVGTSLPIDKGSRLTFEISPPGEPMSVFDVFAVTELVDRIVLQLSGRPAICKPRHRAAVQAAPCCGRAPACCA